MTDLRKAIKLALEALEEYCITRTITRPIASSDALRQALKQPEREWVGLHLDDVPEEHVVDRSFLRGARWAEVKLKEKNT